MSAWLHISCLFCMSVPYLKLVHSVPLLCQGSLHVSSQAGGLAAHLLPVSQLQLLLLVFNLMSDDKSNINLGAIF